MAAKLICSIDGCDNPARCRTWCETHHGRWRRHGDPLKTLHKRGTKKGEVLKWMHDHLDHKGEECLTWPFNVDGDNRGIFKNSEGRGHVCTYFCKAVNGPKPTPEHEVAHSCGKGTSRCCNPSHLRWATKVENAADRLIHGTAPIGIKHGMAKLTEAQVMEIRRLKGKKTQREIAAPLNISASTVGAIHRGKIWQHLP